MRKYHARICSGGEGSDSPAYRNKLEPDGKQLTFTDGNGIGTVRLIGKKGKIETYPSKQIKRVRLVKRADGYYVQFAVKTNRTLPHEPTGKQVGIDVGLKAFYTDSDGKTVDNPRYLRKAEKRLKRLHRRVSKKQKRSKNRKKAIQRLAKGYLKVQRQRKDFAEKRGKCAYPVQRLGSLRRPPDHQPGEESSACQKYQRRQLGAVPLLTSATTARELVCLSSPSRPGSPRRIAVDAGIAYRKASPRVPTCAPTAG